MTNNIEKPTSASVIQLAERAHEIIDITELEPDDGSFIGKRVNRNGSITQYPTTVAWWRQSVVRVPASVSHVFAYLREARSRNICLIRGAPANLERQRTRRQRAHEVKHGRDRGDHGFTDEPTKLLFLDVDGARMKWKADPEGAIRTLVAQLGEPWASTSFCWFFSATHGLELDECKHWTGRISDGRVHARLVFVSERALTAEEAGALTKIMKAHAPELKLDASIARVVQPNYIKRPHWVEHPDRDVLGDIPTIGWIKGAREYLAVPDDLTHQARWAKAQGHNVDIADHPDAETAVRGVGIDGAVRSHLMSAVVHLLLANPAPDVVSFADHAIAIVNQLRSMAERHRDEIIANLKPFGRGWSDVLHYLPDNMIDWAHWCLDHPGALNRKTIKLMKEERVEPDDAAKREAIFARVARTIERAGKGEAIEGGPLNPYKAYANEVLETPPVVLLVAPTGGRKSTLMRTAAVMYVAEHPDESVVILMPRHKLGDEQIDMLQQEHPDGNYSAAVWRGRHAWDPNVGNGHEERMCQRSEEAEEVEKAMLDVGSNLCKQGRGEKAIKCPLYDGCAYQQQKQVAANIWFAAHECAVHEMPKAFGNVGWVIFDESPLDAFMFGIDINDQVTLELDALRSPLTPAFEKDPNLEINARVFLMPGREALYEALDKLRVPIDRHEGVPASKQSLIDFIGKTLYGAHARKWRKQHDQFDAAGRRLNYGVAPYGPVRFMRKHDAHMLRALEWRGKVEPDIRPDMTKKQVWKELAKAADNGTVKKRATLWQLIEQVYGSEQELRIQQGDKQASEDRLYGRIQVHRGKEGRVIRMVGLHHLTKGWNVRTLICDATGDAELLRAIWPQLEEAEPHGWEQLPRPESVRIMQVVDRSLSKWLMAIEGKNEKALARKEDAARRVYAALLMQALEYGGAPVAAIVYKSTEEWILENCFVPEWLTLMHHGGVTGTNALQNVRALFVVGRPLASAEDLTRQAEALFGEYVRQREYQEWRKLGRIPIVPDAKGNNTIRVDVRRHPHVMAERLRRQVTEGALIQAVGRARGGLRAEGEPLDIHLWTNVPVPEIGPVEPVLWEEVAADLDGIMLASGGVWLQCVRDAGEAYEGLFTVDGLKSARKGGVGVSLIGNPYKQNTHTSLIRYQRAGKGQRPHRALALMDPAAARAWLEEKLGPLVKFEIVEGKDEAGSQLVRRGQSV